MNKQFLFLIFSVSVLLTSCKNDSSSSYSTSQSASLKRASVAIAPVIDHSESGLCWDLSDEFTYSVSTRLAQKTKLSIADPQKTRMQIKKNKPAASPFGSDLLWVKKTFPGEDFVVFMELIEHREQLRNSGGSKAPESLAADLNLALRLRIIDTRKEQPLVILQEIIQDSHFIPRQFTQYNFQQAPWNSEEFGISPIGIAHSLLVKELSSRIDDYISLSKS